ncbi:hypothetical protein HZS_3161, partial [Henneguya salminicola]
MADVLMVEDFPNTTLTQQINHLEDTLEFSPNFVIIESESFAVRIAKWLAMGNLLHKAATISGLFSFFINILSKYANPYPTAQIIRITLACISLSTSFMYNFFWSPDPCSKYQIVKNSSQLRKFNYLKKKRTKPSLILIKKNDKYRKILHSFLSLAAIYPYIHPISLHLGCL